MWIRLPAVFLQPSRLCEGTHRWYDAHAYPSGRRSKITGLLFDVCFDVCFHVCFDLCFDVGFDVCVDVCFDLCFDVGFDVGFECMF